MTAVFIPRTLSDGFDSTLSTTAAAGIPNHKNVDWKGLVGLIQAGDLMGAQILPGQLRSAGALLSQVLTTFKDGDFAVPGEGSKRQVSIRNLVDNGKIQVQVDRSLRLETFLLFLFVFCFLVFWPCLVKA